MITGWCYKRGVAHHDNGKVRIGTGCAQTFSTRVPSIKRSDKIWRNFYRLFPHHYEMMREVAERQGVTSGAVVVTRTKYLVGDEHRFSVKYKVLDMTGEFTKLSRRFHHTPLQGDRETIPDHHSNRIDVR